ncbi:hypothetical protein VB264_12090 [Arcicella aquatica]|uniref:Lipoprotein n=1 Tax=Arcicella aquatica TaxID=217141 RepID=A0ABU5QN82_9BACT|nr:hypothetical protein [Arcicella aquatica]MEA5258526.1 hypothetical protein [Arcicella aquatica]
MKTTKIKSILTSTVLCFLFATLLMSCKETFLEEGVNIKKTSTSNNEITLEGNYLSFKDSEDFVNTLTYVSTNGLDSRLNSLNKKGFKSLNSIYIDLLNEYKLTKKLSSESEIEPEEVFFEKQSKKYNNAFLIKRGEIIPNTFNLAAQFLVNKDRIVKIGGFIYQFDYDTLRIIKTNSLKKDLSSISNYKISNEQVDVKPIKRESLVPSTVITEQGNDKKNLSLFKTSTTTSGDILFGNIIETGFMYMYFNSTVRCRIENLTLAFADCEYVESNGHGPVGSDYVCYGGYQYVQLLQLSMAHGLRHENIWGVNDFESYPSAILEMKAQGYFSDNIVSGTIPVNLYSGYANENIQQQISNTYIINERKNIYNFPVFRGQIMFSAKVRDLTDSNGNQKNITLTF